MWPERSTTYKRPTSSRTAKPPCPSSRVYFAQLCATYNYLQTWKPTTSLLQPLNHNTNKHNLIQPSTYPSTMGKLSIPPCHQAPTNLPHSRRRLLQDPGSRLESNPTTNPRCLQKSRPKTPPGPRSLRLPRTHSSHKTFPADQRRVLHVV